MSDRATPALPGAIVRHQVFDGLKLTQVELACALELSTVRVCNLLRGRAPITVSVALRLERVSLTDAAYWLQLQADYDLYHARQAISEAQGNHSSVKGRGKVGRSQSKETG